MKKKINNLLNKIIEKKKIVIMILICLVVVVFLISFFKGNNNISVEVASNVNYIFGPNGETVIKINKGDKVDLFILSNSSKKYMTKCYSENVDIVKFNSFKSFEALNDGETEVYCKLLDKESNRIKVKIGG